MTILVYYGSKPRINRFHGLQREIYQDLEKSLMLYQYDTVHQLLFEILLRKNIIEAAKRLHESKVEFAPFATSKFNSAIWIKTQYGYLLKPGVLPSDAIKDVYRNSSKYVFECSTAVMIILYKAVLDSISVSYFNFLFQGLLVWDWNLDQDLGIVTKRGRDFIPGDVVYFYNPEFSHPVWTGENSIYLGGNLYFGHGIGIETEEGMVTALNTLRKKNATQSAFLISQYSRLNAKYLAQFSKQHLV